MEISQHIMSKLLKNCRFISVEASGLLFWSPFFFLLTSHKIHSNAKIINKSIFLLIIHLTNKQQVIVHTCECDILLQFSNLFSKTMTPISFKFNMEFHLQRGLSIFLLITGCRSNRWCWFYSNLKFSPEHFQAVVFTNNWTGIFQIKYGILWC